MTTVFFLDNGIDPSNHHAKFEIFLGSTGDFIKILEVSEFPIGLYHGWHMGNSLTSRIFIKSAEYLTSLKFGLMITWVNTIVQNFFRCHSNKR